MKINFLKLKTLLAEIIHEQATCEFSGTNWGSDKLKDLDNAIKEEKDS